MNNCDGFSLTEVLVSLVIVSSASMALLQQQWHVSRYTHQINHRNEALRQLDNASEQLVAQRLPCVDSSYQLTTTVTMHQTVLQLQWEDGSVTRLLGRAS